MFSVYFFIFFANFMFWGEEEKEGLQSGIYLCSANLDVPPIHYDNFESISKFLVDSTMKSSKLFKDTIPHLGGA